MRLHKLQSTDLGLVCWHSNIVECSTGAGLNGVESVAVEEGIRMDRSQLVLGRELKGGKRQDKKARDWKREQRRQTSTESLAIQVKRRRGAQMHYVWPGDSCGTSRQ